MPTDDLADVIAYWRDQRAATVEVGAGSLRIPTLALAAILDAAEAGMRARDAALEAERQWRPIETAPRDGTAVLLYCPTFYFGAGVYLGWWEGTSFQCCTEGQTLGPYSADGATHWMPLPAPPEDSHD